MRDLSHGERNGLDLEDVRITIIGRRQVLEASHRDSHIDLGTVCCWKLHPLDRLYQIMATGFDRSHTRLQIRLFFLSHCCFSLDCIETKTCSIHCCQEAENVRATTSGVGPNKS